MENGRFNKDTILIGHSAGCPLILVALEKVKVAKVVLVAGFVEPLNLDLEPILKNFDWGKIKTHCREFPLLLKLVL